MAKDLEAIFIVPFEEDRRRLLRGAPVAGAMLALAGCSRASGGKNLNSSLGPSRTVTWAVGTTGSDFVLDISLGVADAATMLGWRFNRVLNTQTTPDAHINSIRQAVTARSDVIVTVAWYQAVIDEIERGRSQGVQFAVVNSLTNPAELERLNVPFAGHEPYATGRIVGQQLAEALVAQGKTSGTVLTGNPFPGSLNIEQRIGGIRDGLASGAGGRGAGLSLVTFPDGAAQDTAASVAIYKAKIKEAGNIAAHAVAGSELSTVPLLKALSELNFKPGQVPVAGWTDSLKTLNLIKSGWIGFALDEGLYHQGLLAVIMTWSMLERGEPATNIAPGHTMVTAANVDALIASYNRRKAAASAYGLS